MLAAADPAAQLVQLADAEPVGVHHDHDGGVGDVDADLDHGGRDEHVDLAGGEGPHHGVLLLRRSAGRAAPRAGGRRAARCGASRRRRGPPAAARRSSPSPVGAPSTSSGSSSAPVVVADPRADDVGLAAGRDLLADPLPGAVHPGRLLARGTTVLDTPPAPLGSWRRVEVSRSPKTVIATVRGIGVAVMTRTCGGRLPLARSASRCSTPNRCCSSTTTRPRSANSTPSWSRAWVPMTMPARPSATSARASRSRGGLERAGEQGDAGAGRVAAELAGPAERAEQLPDAAGVLRRRAPRWGPAGRPVRRRRRPAPSRAGRRRSCPSRPRPAAAGASAGRGRAPRRAAPRPRAGPSVSANGSAASKASSRPPAAARAGDARLEGRGAPPGGERRAAGSAPRPTSAGAARARRPRRSWAGGCRGARREPGQPVPRRISSGSGSSTSSREAARGAEQQLHRRLDDPARDVLGGRVDGDELAGQSSSSSSP